MEEDGAAGASGMPAITPAPLDQLTALLREGAACNVKLPGYKVRAREGPVGSESPLFFHLLSLISPLLILAFVYPPCVGARGRRGRRPRVGGPRCPRPPLQAGRDEEGRCRRRGSRGWRRGGRGA